LAGGAVAAITSELSYLNWVSGTLNRHRRNSKREICWPSAPMG
jgi:hypothetical protein